LERVRRNYRLNVYGYVVMPEHVHLLLGEPQRDTLADALEVVEARSSAAVDGKYPSQAKGRLKWAT
jgi:putative transposase